MSSFLQNIVTSNKIKAIRKNNKKELLQKLDIVSKLKVPYPLKRYYKNIIPLNIFQTWHTKNLPEMMQKSVNYIKYSNPAFKYYLYDDDDCRNFIENNYRREVLWAFDSLIPGAYKADLWRYCVLYKLGGIYLDIKYKQINDFKFINLTEKEHWVLDKDNSGIYNALMVCLPGNEILIKAINQIVENVRNKFYGSSCLDPTGPGLLSHYFTSGDKASFDMRHDFYQNFDNRLIYFNNYIVFKCYKNYLNEISSTQKVSHYSVLWGARQIYK
jgi:mannosyltransferase OCH1-like enzyme